MQLLSKITGQKRIKKLKNWWKFGEKTEGLMTQIVSFASTTKCNITELRIVKNCSFCKKLQFYGKGGIICLVAWFLCFPAIKLQTKTFLIRNKPFLSVVDEILPTKCHKWIFFQGMICRTSFEGIRLTFLKKHTATETWGSTFAV